MTDCRMIPSTVLGFKRGRELYGEVPEDVVLKRTDGDWVDEEVRETRVCVWCIKGRDE